jgi:hypothetical protein
MEMNVEIPQAMSISRQIPTDRKEMEKKEYFNYLGSMITKMQFVHRKLNTQLPWQKQNSTRRFFSPAYKI